MKYIGFVEVKKELSEKEALKKASVIMNERREKGEELKRLFGVHAFLTEPRNAFFVFEVEDETDIIKMQRDYDQIYKIKFIPIIDASKVMEVFQE